jgi:TatD DNase family protein
MDEDDRARTPAPPAPIAARYIDTHCHLDRYPDPRATIAAARAAGVVVVGVSELPSRFQRNELRYREERTVRTAIGLHPLAVARASSMEMSLWRTLTDRTAYVGEVGLDGSQQGKPTLEHQRTVFRRILAHHEITSKVLTVHSRRAEAEVIDALASAGCCAILHWYSGPAKPIQTALAAGMYFSVNPAMLSSKSGRRVLAEVPPDRILTETDGPYAKRAGQPASPSDIPWLVEQIATIWAVDPDDARRRIFENMARLFASRDQSAEATLPRSRVDRSR